ncbi:uncharacterized protein C2845_PM08G12130 [Panicum miliaceum]|uniref:BHLH domain-containing protein n=1 Tax=Panicum miliaceum TaxID=4540 RepID=A0A3L6R2W3_PANMI|nr:uncharacterized protein C2845_PM08G12130 [Panicum miliaceum]
MAAHACCDVVADGATTPAGAAASGRLRLRRPSRALMKKARKLRKATGGKRPRPAAASRTKRVAAIRRKMEALRRLVPAAPCGGGGEERADGRLEELLLHAAGYILRLQMQVRVMQVMVHALNNNPD